jgi:hypothetical protein
MKAIDMSPDQVSQRLRRLGQMRKLCLELSRGVGQRGSIALEKSRSAARKPTSSESDQRIQAG